MGERRRNLELQTGHRFEIIDYGDGEIGLVGRGEQPSNSTCCDMVLAADGWRSLVEVVTQVIGQWQSIETAPRDGRDVLVWTARGSVVAHWVEELVTGFASARGRRRGQLVELRTPAGWRLSHKACRTVFVEPTHWMPLPPGPEVDDER